MLSALGLNAQESAIRIWEGTGLQKKHVELTPYLPTATPRAAVIVCPGGSYSWHDMQNEGHDVAKWLCKNGIAAFVLKYRVQGVAAYITHSRLLARGNQYPDAMEDIQRAIELVRENAEQYGIDANRVGAIGFSAGGHLVMASAAYAHTDFLSACGIEHQVSLRPDFVASIYPVVSMSTPCTHKRSRRALLGEYRKHRRVMRDSLSLERHVPEDCPPVFLLNCADDPVVQCHNSELLDSALTAKAVPHRYIQYQTGGHGFGVSDMKGTEESRQWKGEFLKWLRELFEV